MIEIIPAIDVIDGKCVRLSQGNFSLPTVYSENPVEVAKRFEAAGLKRLHIVDLDGARNGKITNLDVLRQIAEETNLVIDFGGGIKTDDDLKSVFDAGAQMASIGSVAIKDATKFADWMEIYGSDKFLLGADVRDGKIAYNGWQTDTDRDVLWFLAINYSKGVKQAFVTDISKDGLLQGPATRLYKAIHKTLPHLKLIASGGVSSIGDLLKLQRAGCSGVIIGKAIYEGRIKLHELSKYVG